MEEITLGDITLTRYFMLYLEDYDTAVMADFHLGYEDVMAQKGLFLPRLQFPHIMDLLEKIFEKYSPRRFIIDGDLKHEFSRNMPQEWREIEEVIDFISERCELIVIRGNHDNFLRSILKRKGLKLHEKYSLGNYIFVHGHRMAEIDGNKTLIIGHEHPSLTLRDEISATYKLPVFLYSPQLIVLPAVSIYASGTDITKNEFISPILQEYPQNFELYGISEEQGILYLRNLRSLMGEFLIDEKFN